MSETLPAGQKTAAWVASPVPAKVHTAEQQQQQRQQQQQQQQLVPIGWEPRSQRCESGLKGLPIKVYKVYKDEAFSQEVRLLACS
eukprot:1149076-Pelagomonas_calceolata.AAC.1